MRTFILTILLITTIAFGLVKQVKTAARSVDDMLEPAQDAGSPFAEIRRILMEAAEGDVRKLNQIKVGYINAREEVAEGYRRPSGEYRYDAQYALVPILLYPNARDAQVFIVDSDDGPVLMQPER